MQRIYSVHFFKMQRIGSADFFKIRQSGNHCFLSQDSRFRIIGAISEVLNF
jgi:hypothetical protein